MDYINRVELAGTVGACFAICAKDNMAYGVIEYRPVDKCSGVLSDEIIRLPGHYSKVSRHIENCRV